MALEDYAIDARAFADALREQRAMKLTGGWFAVGDWKKIANAAGAEERTTPPGEVADAIDALSAATPSKMTFEDIREFRHLFELIHPFQEGNGRVGRLVMFGQCLANGIMPFIVTDAEKALYYRGLAEYDQTPGFLRDTLRHFQDSTLSATAATS